VGYERRKSTGDTSAGHPRSPPNADQTLWNP
jgi:hypothetical protein